MKRMFQKSEKMKEATKKAMERFKAMSAEELLAVGEKHQNSDTALFLKALADDRALLKDEDL
jgi:hypothetical protein